MNKLPQITTEPLEVNTQTTVSPASLDGFSIEDMQMELLTRAEKKTERKLELLRESLHNLNVRRMNQRLERMSLMLKKIKDG